MEYINELFDNGQAVWGVELSDGSSVIMDDGRPGLTPRSAWLRLRAYCEDEDASITKMWLKFRSHEIRDFMPDNAEGYFFCNSSIGMMGADRIANFFLVGWLERGVLTLQRWKVPELILTETLTRDVDKAGECLILNRKRLTTST